jgi:hypothetical protein
MSDVLSSEQLMGLIQQNQQLLAVLAAEQIGHTHNDKEFRVKAAQMLNDMVTKAPASVMTAQKLHGLRGTFSTLGLDRDIISTHVEPYGIASVLPLLPNNDEDPRFGSLTGFSDDIGSEPAAPCDDAPTGYLKGCNLTAQFGRVARSTETIEMDELGLRINRGDFSDLVLHGMNLDPAMRNGLMPGGMNPNQILNLVIMSQMVSVGVRLERLLVNHMWQGSPANNNIGGGYKEFPGLDNQIATGQVDADTNTACPSLDSDIKNFQFHNVNGSDGNNIVDYMSMVEYFIYTLAADTGMLPCEWVFAMRPQLWYELSRIWPIAYNTDQVAIALAAANNARVTLDGRSNIIDRDNMREMGRIAVNGRTYRVIEDTGILEQNNTTTQGSLDPGEYASDIYMVPLRATGNFPVCYRQHKDYRQAITEFNLIRNVQRFWTDAGVFAWAWNDINFCVKGLCKTEQRVVLRTPQLAGRIQNVKYTPMQHLREADAESAHWVDGGVSLRVPGTKYAVWL